MSGRRPSRRRMAANLAQLYHDRSDFTTRTQRLRFLREYLRHCGAAGSLRWWNDAIARAAIGHARRQYANRDRRILPGDGRYFALLRPGGGWTARVMLSSKIQMPFSPASGLTLSVDAWRKVLADPEGLLAPEGAEVIKDSPSSQVVRRTLRIGDHDVDVFIKRARRKKARRLLGDCFRYGRAVRAFRGGHMLFARRLPTALPLAALERRSGPVLVDSILITEAVPGLPLAGFLRTHLALPPQGGPTTCPRQYRLGQRVLGSLGKLLARLHAHGFAHRDLKGENVLIHVGPDGDPRPVLIDLDGLRPTRRVSRRARFQGLMRLNVSLLECPVVNHAGRLRMLLGYLRRPGCGRIEFKPAWRALEEWSTRKLRRVIRSRRKRQKALRRDDAPATAMERP